MELQATVTIFSYNRYYGRTPYCNYSEQITIPFTLDTYNRTNDAYITFETQIINALTKAMLLYPDIDMFQILIATNYDNIQHGKSHKTKFHNIRIKRDSLLRDDIRNLKYTCEKLYSNIATDINMTLDEIKKCLLDVTETYPACPFTHANKTIDRLRR